MSTKQISLDGVGTVTLYKRRGNRSIRLTVGAGGDIRVTMPYWLPFKAGEQFALKQLDWIEKHRTQSQGHSLQHAQSIGKAHHLYFEAHPTLPRITTRLQHSEIKVVHPYHLPINDPAVQQAAKNACLRALRKEAEQLLPQRLQALAVQTGHNYSSVGVKNLKSRWGSCSSNQDIVLNIFLMQLPWHLIDYVIMHELTHTRVMRHGAPFWKHMEQYVPRAKQLRKEIHNHHPAF